MLEKNFKMSNLASVNYGRLFSVWYRNSSHFVWLTLPHFKNSEVLIISVIDDYQCCKHFRHVGAAVPLMQAMTSSFVIGKCYIEREACNTCNSL